MLISIPVQSQYIFCRWKGTKFTLGCWKTCDTYDSAAERPEPPHQSQSQQKKEHQEHNDHHCAVRLMREGTFTVSLKTG